MKNSLRQRLAIMQAASRDPERNFDLLLRNIEEVARLTELRSRKLLHAGQDALNVAEIFEEREPQEKTG